MVNPAITYAPRSDATLETEISALVNVYRLLLDHAHRSAAGVASANGTILRNTEGVNDVEHQPD